MEMLVTNQLAYIMQSEHQSDTTCTEYDHEIDAGSNLRQKPLENINSITHGSEGKQHQIWRQNNKHQELLP